MRISDWSADVCSSDLGAVGLGDPADRFVPGDRADGAADRNREEHLHDAPGLAGSTPNIQPSRRADGSVAGAAQIAGSAASDRRAAADSTASALSSMSSGGPA